MPRALFRRSGENRLLFALALLLGFSSAFLAGISGVRAQENPFTESTRVHRVQLDVSVIDPEGSDRASVPGLPREAFVLRVDGRDLSPELAARVEFDEMCAPAEALRDERSPAVGPLPPVPEPPTLIILLDLNYLDIGMRANAARGIEELATLASERKVRVKVLAFGRSLFSLSGGFTSDPAAIRAAAGRILELPGAAPSLRPLDLQDERASPTTRATNVPDDTRPMAFLEEREQLESFAGRDIATARSGASASSPGLLPSPLSELAGREVDPRPSLAALESVLLAHSGLRGRKALVLFSGASFELPEELWLEQLEGVQAAADAGFTLWTVEASAGLDDPFGERGSALLGHLAHATGGELLRGPGRRGIALERALAQLSCYYLFSIPLPLPQEKSRRHLIDVRLDSEAFPETWTYRVRAQGSVLLLAEGERQRRHRLAALVEPSRYRFPEVRLSATYPAGRKGISSIGVATLLSDLVFQREPGTRRHRAEIAVEGVVSDARGVPVCVIGDGRRRVIRALSPPVERPPSALVLESRCAIEDPGIYQLRVAIEDLNSGEIGASGARLELLSRREATEVDIAATRLGRNSGRDFLLRLERRNSLEIPRDRARRAFIPLYGEDFVAPQDRVILRFVSCDAEPPHVIGYRVEGGRRSASFQVLVEASAAAGGEGRLGTCQEYEGTIPEGSLSPGRYGLALVARDAAESREELDALLATGEVLESLEFEVSLPPARKEQEKLPFLLSGGLQGLLTGAILTK